MDIRFFDTVGTYFSNAVFNTFGKIDVYVFTNKEQDSVQFVAYNSEGSTENSHSYGLAKELVLFERTYDISRAKSEGDSTLLKKIDEIKRDIDMAFPAFPAN